VIWGSNLVWTNPQSWATTVIWGSDSIGTSYGDTVIRGSTGGVSPQNVAWKNLAGQTGAAGSTGANAVVRIPDVTARAVGFSWSCDERRVSVDARTGAFASAP
jgi:hypothetical protein